MLDFSILHTNNLKTIGIIDESDYNGSSIINPVLSVLVPGFSIWTNVIFKTGKINILNSSNLGLSSGSKLNNLPDGVYQLKLKVEKYLSPTENEIITTTQQYFRTAQLQHKFSNLIAKYIDGCKVLDNELLRKMYETRLMLYSIDANANICEIKKALELYTQVEKDIINLNRQCSNI